MEYIPRRHKGRDMKMGCVWEGCLTCPRVVGKGESVGCAAAEPARESIITPPAVFEHMFSMTL